MTNLLLVLLCVIALLQSAYKRLRGWLLRTAPACVGAIYRGMQRPLSRARAAAWLAPPLPVTPGGEILLLPEIRPGIGRRSSSLLPGELARPKIRAATAEQEQTVSNWRPDLAATVPFAQLLSSLTDNHSRLVRLTIWLLSGGVRGHGAYLALHELPPDLRSQGPLRIPRFSRSAGPRALHALFQ